MGSRDPYSRGALAVDVLRPVLTAGGLLVLYYLLPVDRPLTGWTFVGLLGGLVLIVVILTWQFRVIMRSRHPAARGVEVLALTVPLYLLIFANVFFVLDSDIPGSFSQPLTRTDALYFVMTVFATVGFGDITPVTQTARIVVTGQMVGNLLLIGIALRVILGAVQHALQRKGVV